MRRIVYIAILMILGLPLYGSSNVVLQDEEKSKVTYIQPLDIPVSLSASYGELRRNHFHSGVDLRVGGVVGEPIRAVADGYVSRISVSPTGYGNAIYIDHPDGKTSVYGHMFRYADAIAEYVVDRQYEQKSFRVNLYPEKNSMPVKRGEIIGYVGNTGSSGGPHLHFEIRRTSDQKPLNALSRGYVSVYDDMTPFIKDVVFYGYDRKHLRGWKFASRKNETDDVISVPDCFYVAVDAYDRQNGTGAKLGIEVYRVKLDGETIFEMRTGETPFALTRYINSLLEYAEMDAKGRAYVKTKKDAGNILSKKCSYVNDGLIELADDEVHTVEINLRDEHGNQTDRLFKVRKSESVENSEILPEGSFITWCMPQIQTGEYDASVADGGYRLLIDEGSLYESVYFYADSDTIPEGAFSPVVRLFDRRVPLQKSMKFSLDVTDYPEKLKDKLVLARILPSGKKVSAGGKLVDEHRFESDINVFGDFCVVADTVPPKISALFQNGMKLKGDESLVYKISDDFSGVWDYELSVDGKWTLADYDPKTRRVIVRMKYSRMERTGGKHVMKLVVRDGGRNVKELERTVVY